MAKFDKTNILIRVIDQWHLLRYYSSSERFGGSITEPLKFLIRVNQIVFAAVSIDYSPFMQMVRFIIIAGAGTATGLANLRNTCV